MTEPLTDEEIEAYKKDHANDNLLSNGAYHRDEDTEIIDSLFATLTQRTKERDEYKQAADSLEQSADMWADMLFQVKKERDEFKRKVGELEEEINILNNVCAVKQSTINATEKALLEFSEENKKLKEENVKLKTSMSGGVHSRVVDR